MIKRCYFLCIALLIVFQIPAQRKSPVDSVAELVPKQSGKEKAKSLLFLSFELYKKDKKKAISFRQQVGPLAGNDEEILLGMKLFDLMVEIAANPGEKTAKEILGIADEFDKLKLTDKSYQARRIYLKYLDDAGKFAESVRYNHYMLSREPDGSKNQASLFLSMGRRKQILGETDSAIWFYENAIKGFTKLGDRKSKAGTMMNLGVIYYNLGNPKRSDDCYYAAYAESKAAADTNTMAKCLINIGLSLQRKGKLDESKKLFLTAGNYYLKTGDSLNYASLMDNLGNTEKDLGNFKRSLEYFFLALKMREQMRDTFTLADSYGNLTNMNYIMGNSRACQEYAYKALYIARRANNKQKIAFMLMQLGVLHNEAGKLDSAMYVLEQALKLYKEINEPSGLADTYVKIGLCLESMGKFDKAEASLLKAHLISRETENVEGLAYSGRILMDHYSKVKNHKNAVKYGEEAFALLQKSNELNDMPTLLGVLAPEHAYLGNYKRAFELSNYALMLNDSMFNKNSQAAFAEMQTKYETDNKIKQIQLLEKDKTIADKELQQKKSERNMLIGGLGMAAAVLLLVARAYTQKKKSNKLLAEQKKLIEIKHTEITDSINYAQRIQNAILTTDNWANVGKENFVLFMPKDVVSGDFYWAHVLRDGTMVWAVADCTGHGVPGAFMSMIGIAYLNQIVAEQGVIEPSEILNRLRERIINTLEQKNADHQQKDGMDISLCICDKNRKQLKYAGANNSIYVIRKKQLFELKPDKMPIGLTAGEIKPFATQTFDLEPDDVIYNFSDGFADQFGGKKGKKYMSRNMKEMLCRISDLTLPEQKRMIKLEFENWKGAFEQLDDVCLTGVKV